MVHDTPAINDHLVVLAQDGDRVVTAAKYLWDLCEPQWDRLECQPLAMPVSLHDSCLSSNAPRQGDGLLRDCRCRTYRRPHGRRPQYSGLVQKRDCCDIGVMLACLTAKSPARRVRRCRFVMRRDIPPERTYGRVRRRHSFRGSSWPRGKYKQYPSAASFPLLIKLSHKPRKARVLPWRVTR